MPLFLESQIALLERGVPSPDASEVEDLIAFYLTALERLERRLGPHGISEADRALIPLFQRWLTAAGRFKEIVQALRNEGRVVNGYDDLLRAMNRSKPVAERFDHFVALNKRLSNERSTAGTV